MEKKLRVAVRKFAPFESAIVKQWQDFEKERRSGFILEPVALELLPLTEALFDSEGLRNGTWDIAFINTDWVAAACHRRELADLHEFIQANPPEDYPHGWTDSMLRLQQKEGIVAGLPYHDGPECLLYRKDLFESPAQQQAYRAAYGVPLNPPYSWDEFLQIAHFFHRPAQGIYGASLPAIPMATTVSTTSCFSFGHVAARSRTSRADFVFILRKRPRLSGSIAKCWPTRQPFTQKARHSIVCSAERHSRREKRRCR